MVKAVLQHDRLEQSNQLGIKKGSKMGGLATDWLSTDLALVDADIDAWSPGLKASYDSLYGEEDPLTSENKAQEDERSEAA